MGVLNQLSSQKGDKTEIANKLVAEKCIANGYGGKLCQSER